MVPAEEARLEGAEDPETDELLTAVEAERDVEAAAAAAARVADEVLREAVETVRVAVRAAADADPEAGVLEAVAMRAGVEALEADALLEAVRPVPVRTTRPTPPRGLAGMRVPCPERVASSRSRYLGPK